MPLDKFPFVDTSVRLTLPFAENYWDEYVCDSADLIVIIIIIMLVWKSLQKFFQKKKIKIEVCSSGKRQLKFNSFGGKFPTYENSLPLSYFSFITVTLLNLPHLTFIHPHFLFIHFLYIHIFIKHCVLQRAKMKARMRERRSSDNRLSLALPSGIERERGKMRIKNFFLMMMMPRRLLFFFSRSSLSLLIRLFKL